MHIEIEFNIGDPVWFVTCKGYGTKCKVCIGDGALYNINQEPVKCVNCYGSGEIQGIKYIPISGNVTDINGFKTKNSKIEVHYDVGEINNYSGCFKTEGEAAEAAKEMNKMYEKDV